MSKKTPDVTFSEWLNALREAEQAEPDEEGTVTTSEVCRALGCSGPTAMTFLRGLLAAGVVRPDLVPRRTLWGTSRRPCGWRILKPAEFRAAVDGRLGK